MRQLQFTEQFSTWNDGTTGRSVAARINDVLLKVPCRLMGIHNILVDKIGGADHQVIVLFERTDV